MRSKNETAARQVKEQGVFASEQARIKLPPGPSHEEVERRAYEIYVARGGIHGQDLEDWLQAERELKAKYPVNDARGLM